jgi:hypothetical protein
MCYAIIKQQHKLKMASLNNSNHQNTGAGVVSGIGLSVDNNYINNTLKSLNKAISSVIPTNTIENLVSAYENFRDSFGLKNKHEKEMRINSNIDKELKEQKPFNVNSINTITNGLIKTGVNLTSNTEIRKSDLSEFQVDKADVSNDMTTHTNKATMNEILNKIPYS